MTTAESMTDRLADAEKRLSGIEQDRADAALARQLREAVARLVTVATVATPRSDDDLSELILRAAAQVLRAKAAILYSADRATEELVLQTVLVRDRALAAAAEQIRGRRSPINAGIVGWVAMSGQPAVRSDLEKDPQFQAAVAHSVGYMPSTTLCIPLTNGDTVVGVVQLFDRDDGSEFGPEDMSALDAFGGALGVAMHQSMVMANTSALFGFVLERLLADSPDLAAFRRDGVALVDRVSESDSYKEAARIATLVGEIGDHGPDARREALEVLESLARYLRGRAGRENLGGRLW